MAPTMLVELFSYLTTPGLTDEEVTVFLAAVDASRLPDAHARHEGERISMMRVPIAEGACLRSARCHAQRPAVDRAAMAGAQPRASPC